METAKELRNKERRRDIGSGTYWELLNKDFLQLFVLPQIRPKVLGIWGFDAVRSNITFNDNVGIGTFARSGIIRAMVTTVEGARNIRNFLDEHGGAVRTVDLVNEIGVGGANAVAEALVKVFSQNVTFGIVRDYSGNKAEVKRFINDHKIRGDDLTPRYKLVSEHTTDTGHTNVLLKSIRSPQGQTGPGGHPAYRSREQVDSEKAAGLNKFNSYFAEAAVKMSRLLPDRDLTQDNLDDASEMIIDPFATEEYIPLEEQMTVKDDGLFEVHRASRLDESPSMSIGGPSNVRIDTADRIVNGTAFQAYSKEQLITSPTITLPSAHFAPNPGLISSIFSPLSLVQDPAILLGLIAIVALSDRNSSRYTSTYNILPTQVIDNEPIEKELFD